jgi:hypothetical protein
VKHPTASVVIVAVALAVCAWAGGGASGVVAAEERRDSPALFFRNLKALCGKQFEGATEFPPDPDHPLAGKKLVISIAHCSDSEVRIPLTAGEDKSRTWIVALRPEGLLLKHDHRHPDGTPDKITMYGGWATDGDAHRQRFAADEETAKLIPEAATNVWTIEFDPATGLFSYALERHGQPRYRAVFRRSGE